MIKFKKVLTIFCLVSLFVTAHLCKKPVIARSDSYEAISPYNKSYTLRPPPATSTNKGRERLNKALNATASQSPEKVSSLIVERLKGQMLDVKHVAQQLDIPQKSAENALELLVAEGKLYKDGDKYVWVVSGGSGKEAPESLKQEYLNAAREHHAALYNPIQEVLQLPSGISREEWNRQVAEIEKKYNVQAITRRYKEAERRINNYNAPEGYLHWYAWMKAELGIDTEGGSPQAVFNLLSNGQTFTRQEIARILKRSERTIQPDLYFLIRVGLLIKKGKGPSATYVINPELSKNPDLIRRIQGILDEEFKVLKTGWDNQKRIREMIFEAALKMGSRFAPRYNL